MTPQALHQTPERIATPRLLLEKIHPAHAERLRAAVLRSRDDLEFVHWARGPWDLDHALHFCRHTRHAMERGDDILTYLAFESRRRPERFVGLLDLHTFDFSVPRCQIGYVGDSAVRGLGLMREAALALIKHAHRWGVVRIEAWCDTRNRRSIEFSESLGLRPEGVLRHAARDPQGELCDQLVLARLAAEPLPAAGSAPLWQDTVPTMPRKKSIG